MACRHRGYPPKPCLVLDAPQNRQRTRLLFVSFSRKLRHRQRHQREGFFWEKSVSSGSVSPSLWQPRALVVATNIRIRKPENYDSFIQCLESEGYFETITDDNGNQQWIPTRPRVRSISILLLRDQKQMGKHVIEGCPNYLPSQDVDCRCGNQRFADQRDYTCRRLFTCSIGLLT